MKQLQDSNDRVRRPRNDVRTDEYDDRLHRTVLDSQALAIGCLANVGDRVARLMVEDMLLVVFAAVERREILRIGDLLVEIEGRLGRVDLPDDLMDANVDGEENDQRNEVHAQEREENVEAARTRLIFPIDAAVKAVPLGNVGDPVVKNRWQRPRDAKQPAEDGRVAMQERLMVLA